MACEPEEEPPPPDNNPPAFPTTCFVGDESAEPVIEPIFRDVDGNMQPLVDGSEVPLILPPQGGKVMFIGVRAQNMDGCPLVIGTSLRDTNTDAIVTLERRPVRMEEVTPGVLTPRTPEAITNYSNLPGCPRANIAQDVHGVSHELTITVEDQDARKAEVVLNVIPTCSQPQFLAQCLCECDADYTTGQDCTAGGEGEGEGEGE